LWLAYLAWQLPSVDSGWDNFSWPGAAWMEKWRFTWRDLRDPVFPWAAWTTLGVMIGITVQMLWLLLRWRPTAFWWRFGVGHAAMALFLGTVVWEGYPGAAARVLLPLQLAFNALAVKSSRAVLWLVLGNLGLGAGLLAIASPPRPAGEMAAARLGDGAAVTLTLADGWYALESSAQHVWAWSAGDAKCRAHAWINDASPRSKQPQRVRMSFVLRALEPRDVALRRGDAEIWRGRAEPNAKQRQSVEVTLVPGDNEFEFISDGEPVPDPNPASPRLLAFALYDVRIEPLR